MNSKFKAIVLFAFVGVFVGNFLVQHSSILRAIFNKNPLNSHVRSSNLSFGVDQILKIDNFYGSLEASELKIFSQNGEDGVIEKLLVEFGLPSSGFYIEFGAGDGLETNTRNLREFRSWTGLMFDSTLHNVKLRLFAESITHLNVLEILNKHKVERGAIDLLSLDTDFADYWVLEKILSGGFKPKLIVHEVNREGPTQCVSVPKLNGLAFWDNVSTFYGASVCAFYCLARRFGFSMVYCEKTGVNCFWVRNDLLEAAKFDVGQLQRVLDPAKLFRLTRVSLHISDRKWQYLDKCF